jgi:hypothetical protein
LSKAIGDTIGLSVLTRKHLKTIGVIDDDAMSYGINFRYAVNILDSNFIIKNQKAERSNKKFK